MKPVIIIAIAFVLLIPISIQSMYGLQKQRFLKTVLIMIVGRQAGTRSDKK